MKHGEREQVEELVAQFILYLNISLAIIFWNPTFIAIAIMVYSIENMPIAIIAVLTLTATIINEDMNLYLLFAGTGIIFVALTLVKKDRLSRTGSTDRTGKTDRTGQVVTALIIAGIASSMITSSYYCKLAQRECGIQIDMVRVDGELGMDRLIDSLDRTKIYKDNLYKIIDTIKEDSVYMADISGTENTEESKISYLEGIAMKFLDNQNPKLDNIGADKIRDNLFVDASIQKYLREAAK